MAVLPGRPRLRPSELVVDEIETGVMDDDGMGLLILVEALKGLYNKSPDVVADALKKEIGLTWEMEGSTGMLTGLPSVGTGRRLVGTATEAPRVPATEAVREAVREAVTGSPTEEAVAEDADAEADEEPTLESEAWEEVVKDWEDEAVVGNAAAEDAFVFLVVTLWPPALIVESGPAVVVLWAAFLVVVL